MPMIFDQLRVWKEGLNFQFEGSEKFAKHLYFPMHFMFYMILILFALNIVWSYLVLRILFNFLTKGSFHNDAHGEKANKLRKDK